MLRFDLGIHRPSPDTGLLLGKLAEPCRRPCLNRYGPARPHHDFPLPETAVAKKAVQYFVRIADFVVCSRVGLPDPYRLTFQRL